MDTKVYGAHIVTFKHNPDSTFVMVDENILANVYPTPEAADVYGRARFEQHIKDLGDKGKRIAECGFEYIDPETYNLFWIYYETFALNFIASSRN